MNRTDAFMTALALVSLSAACTSSQPILSAQPPGAGAAGSSASPYAPLAPISFAPTSPLPPVSAPVSAVGAGGAADQAACAGSMAAMAMPTPIPVTPFQPDLSGPVVTAASAPRPVSGGTLLVTRDGGTAVASDPDRDVVYVVDLKTRAVRAETALWAGDEPGRLVEDGAGLVHVSLRRGGAVVTLDPATGLITRREAVCAAPRGLAYDHAADLIHVACAEGTLVSLRPTGGVARTVTLRRDLRDVVVTSAGKLLVSTFRSADVLALGADGNVAADLRPPARRGVSALTAQPRTMSPAVAWRMVPVGDGGALLLHQRGLDEAVSPAPGGYASGKGCDGIVESATTIVAPDATAVTSPGLALVTLAVDVAVSPDGTMVAIAAAGNTRAPLSSVVSLPMAAVTQDGGGCVSGGLPPPPATGADDAVLPPSAPPPGQVIAVAYEPTGAVVSQSRDPAALWTSDGRGVISLSQEPTADTGHQLFHMDAGGGIACASCHPEGGEDGRVWNFACLGPRRTQSLRGGLSGTEPFHWDGDMSTFKQLVREVFVGRMSGPQPSDDQSAAMLSWLDSVPELPNPAPAGSAAVGRGRELFASTALGCTSCHAGAHLTNNLTVDVGTGLPLQVPSLRGVAWRAPFLHTGCAPTLADRFGTCGGGDKHGHTSQLAPTDISDLTAYLETL